MLVQNVVSVREILKYFYSESPNIKKPLTVYTASLIIWYSGIPDIYYIYRLVFYGLRVRSFDLQ
jgi:hypothetical protein